jgi:hypothetical protein
MRVPNSRRVTRRRPRASAGCVLLGVLAAVAGAGCAAPPAAETEVLAHRHDFDGRAAPAPRPTSWRTAMTRSLARRAAPYVVGPAVLFAALVPIRGLDWAEVQSAAGSMLLDGGGSRVAVYDSAAGGAAAPLDPLGLLRRAQQRCAQEVRDYACLFLRQERVGGKLTKPQTIKVLYREQPQSVHMTWIRNTDRVRRACYVKGRLVNERGEEEALIEPAGPIARLFVGELKVPIHGPEARKSGRFTIDQFGFHAVLDRLLRENERYTALGGVKWSYEGTGAVDGRPTHVLVRQLPYAGPGGDFPDARLVVHLDQEYLWPVAIHSFADRQERELLGSYVTTRVELNPGLTDGDFELLLGK